ncbi:MAG: AarF/UbiB family protein [Acidobacteriota bacterium]|nr:AarF/UbiB family protein [Acidobacteriota bacterium]
MDTRRPVDGRPWRQGPLGAAFAAYLASRVDFPIDEKMLGPVSPSAPEVVTPPDAARERITHELGVDPEEAFASFESQPFDSGPLLQWHRVRLIDGQGAVLKLVHPEIDRSLSTEAAGPSELGDHLGWLSAEESAGAIADFRSFLDRSIDLRREAADLERLRERCDGMSLVTIPKVYDDLGGARCLTLAGLQGSTIAERCRAAPEKTGDGPRLARRLCRAWLRVAFSAGTVPESPSGRNVLLVADGKVAFCGGPFESLSSHARDQLRRYLAAVVVDDHEVVAEVFLDLSHRRSRHDERRLCHKLRHTAPFRDGGLDCDFDSLSRSVLSHWHQAAALGFRPHRVLMAFLRGLAVLTRQAYALAPGEDSFREAFQEIRLYQLFADLGGLPNSGEMAPLTDLPRKLDRGLALAADPKLRRRRPAEEEASTGSWSLVLALLMALGAVAWLVHHFAPAVWAPGWIERAGAVAALILGGFLLRLASDES